MLILRPRLQGSGQIFERTKTCTDPPFVYMGPEQLLKYSNICPDLYKPVEGRKRMFFKYDDAIHHNTSSSTSIAHALWGILPYYHSLAFSYGRANTIRMATCGRTYIHIFILFFFLFWKRRKKGSILKNIRIRVDGVLAMWNSTHTCSISLYQAPFWKCEYRR